MRKVDMQTSIRYFDYFIPEEKISSLKMLQEYNKQHGISMSDVEIDSILEDLGIERVAVFSKYRYLVEAADKLLTKMFEQTGIDPSEIAYIVSGNNLLIEDEVSVVHYIQKKFEMSNALILPITQACVASVLTMGLSNKLLQFQSQKYLIMLNAYQFSPDRHINVDSRYVGFSILGDGVSLILIENRPGAMNIKDWAFMNDGMNSFSSYNNNGKEIKDLLSFQRKVIADGVKLLKKISLQANKKINDFDAIIQPNTNIMVFKEIYPALLNIESSKFYLKNIRDGGHIVDVDLIRNLKDYLSEAKKDKLKILVYAKGMSNTITRDIIYHALWLDVNNEKTIHSSGCD